LALNGLKTGRKSKMNDSQVPIDGTVIEIRAITQSKPGDTEGMVEKYLEEKLQGVRATEKLAFLEKLIQQFKGFGLEMKTSSGFEPEELSRLFFLLLGKRISVSDLPPEELLRKLAQSLNTVFDTVNKIISDIQTALLGQRAQLETIRLIIGSQLEGDEGSNPLQSYLDQIRQAFLVAHTAFQQATHTKVGQILAELDPEKLERSTDTGLKFGPFRKAELFEMMKDKLNAYKMSFVNGGIDQEFLREFEKVCQKLYSTKIRRVP